MLFFGLLPFRRDFESYATVFRSYAMRSSSRKIGQIEIKLIGHKFLKLLKAFENNFWKQLEA